MNKLKIAIDGNEANTSNRVGSNVYAYEIISNLYNLVRNKPIEITVLLSTPPIGDLPKENKKWRYRVIKPAKFWTQWALPIHLFLHKNDYDVLYTPGHYAPRISSIPYVSSVMDLAFLHYPEQFKKKDLHQLKNWTAYSVKNAKKIITISQFSKQDILHNYGRTPEDVLIAYPSVNPPDQVIAPIHTKKVLEKFSIKQPYILYLGTIQPRKNLITLVEAFETLSRKLPLGRKKISSLQLVIAGKIGWLADDLVDRVNSSPVKKNIILTGFVTDFEKNVLLKNASTLAMVGLYEGFGIPPLEALQYDLIPVVSNTSSLPEVVGDAGLLADPKSPNDIAQKLENVLTMSAREQLKFKKFRTIQLSLFRWNESANLVLKTLERVAQEHANYSRN